MKKTIEILKALADKTRLEILLLLSRREMAVCELIDALKLSQPAVSHHLKILKYAQLVKDTRDGKWVFYSIDEKKFLTDAKVIEEFCVSVQENLRKGIQVSPVRTNPCLCDDLQKKAKPESGKTQGYKISVCED